MWRYQYPGQENVFAYTDMYVPSGVTVLLDIKSDDVAHSWWIPKLGGKMDAIPGYTNHTWFRADKPGVYRGQCAELCGRNHANMLRRRARAAAGPVPGVVPPPGGRGHGRQEGPAAGRAAAPAAAEQGGTP